MPIIKLTQEEAEALCYDDSEDFELVESDNWKQNGKYQFCTSIYKHLSTGKHYSTTWRRSGSHHTDWYYSWEDEGAELVEVEKREKVITTVEWVEV